LVFNEFQNPQPKLRAYAEVYGVDKNGEVAPACWIGGMITLTDITAELVLDLNWLALAGVKGPLTLQNVIINDVTNNFPVSEFAGPINVANSNKLSFRFSKSHNITEEMRFGKNPFPKTDTNLSESSNVPNLLMLPGYCTGENPFQPSGKHFQQALFPAFKGNFGHDEYALKMSQAAVNAGMTSFGIIGHSQGGIVATHLMNFYWSGVNNAKGGKLIQTVASPFLGNTAAGSSASLGELFGIGCGANSDLSRDGSINWLQGISMETRKHVHFYTATYEQGKFFGDWCSFPMNLILEWPNDGVAELVYSSLPGAVNMGNKEKWCHSVDMTYPSVCTDQQRNQQMNQNAAR